MTDLVIIKAKTKLKSSEAHKSTVLLVLTTPHKVATIESHSLKTKI